MFVSQHPQHDCLHKSIASDGVKDTSVKAKAKDLITMAKDLLVKAKYDKAMASTQKVRAKDIYS